MNLFAAIDADPRSAYILEFFSGISESAKLDVSIALGIMCDKSSGLEKAQERLNRAYTMCRNMRPEAEDVIALLLHVAYGNHKAGLLVFKEWYRDGRAKHYSDVVSDRYKNAPCYEGMTRCEQIDHYIMIRVCEKMFDSMIRAMNKKNIPDTVEIVEAYELAKKAHHGACRISGEPYLTHPICVAEILADVGVESTIIAAALLHDVVEDTPYTLDDITEKCGLRVAKYVDAVTSVHRQFEESHNRSEYVFDKAELDAKSFEKLVEAVSTEDPMIFALYIKAADRIHNLRTIDGMSDVKKHSKTDETELDYLPLFKKFNLNYFVNIIEDLVWRTNNAEYHESIKRKYEDILFRNREYIDEMKKILTDRLKSELCRDGGYTVTVSEKYYLTKEVYEFAKVSLGTDISLTEKHICKRSIPVCDLDVIIDTGDKSFKITEFIKCFSVMFSEYIAPTGRTVTDMQLDGSDRFTVTVEDRHRTVFRLCFSTREAYIAYRIGNVRGSASSDSGDECALPVKDMIYVKLRNDKRIPMPVGSTVLDVAFVIHPEVGLSALSATVNGKQASIYNRVHDEDHIIVEADTYRTDGVTKKFIPHVKINWLNHVVTEKARKTIIKRLMKKYEEEDPTLDYSASDITAENVVLMLIDELSDSDDFNGLESRNMLLYNISANR